jgi:hypothetical protein
VIGDPVKCPKCRAPLEQQVSVIVRCPASFSVTNKKSIKHRSVQVIGADYLQSSIYCPDCGYVLKKPGEEKPPAPIEPPALSVEEALEKCRGWIMSDQELEKLLQ